MRSLTKLVACLVAAAALLAVAPTPEAASDPSPTRLLSLFPPAGAPALGALRPPAAVSPPKLPHPPIFIDADSDFAVAGVPNVANGVVGGSGTAGDPYRIEGWNLMPTLGGSSGLYLSGTTAYVLIRNNTALGHRVSSSDGGTTLTSTTGAGIKVVNARNVRVEDNVLTGNAFNLVLYGSRLIGLHGNTMTGGTTGWWMEDMSGPVTGTGNTVAGNFRNFGVFSKLGVVGYVHDLDATNAIGGKPMRYLVGASNVVVDNATTEAGFVGIVNGNNVRVTGYRFVGNIVGGLVAGGTDVSFDNVTATLNEAAILLSHTTRATVADSSFEWNTIGAWLERATKSRLTHDWFGNQSRGCCLAIGVLLHYRADDNRIDNSTFHKNEDALDALGFAGPGCPARSKVRDNNFQMNGVAVFEEFEWVFCLPNEVDAVSNYWGAANGPSSAEGLPLPGGDGDGITDDVLWTPFHGFPVTGARPRP